MFRTAQVENRLRRSATTTVPKRMCMTIDAFIAAAFTALICPVSAFAESDPEVVQSRYKDCMVMAEVGYGEDFRGSCDATCIRQSGRSELCLSQHTRWDTGNCTLPIAEFDRQELRLERAKDRCLKELKAGVTTPP